MRPFSGIDLEKQQVQKEALWSTWLPVARYLGVWVEGLRAAACSLHTDVRQNTIPKSSMV